MTDHRTIMTAESINAIIEGRKNQTRRVLSRTACTVNRYRADKDTWGSLQLQDAQLSAPRRLRASYHRTLPPGGRYVSYCQLAPVVSEGDRFWVRETWCCQADPITGKLLDSYHYRADGGDVRHVDGGQTEAGLDRSPWRSPLFMPKAAARLWLLVKDVRFERLQDITGADVLAEGIRVPVTEDGHVLIDCSSSHPASRYLKPGFTVTPPDEAKDALLRAYFASGWDQLNAKRGYPWEDNPLVLVYGFRVLEARTGQRVGGDHNG